MRFRLKAIICTPEYIKIQQETTAPSKMTAIDNFLNLIEEIIAEMGNFDIDLYEVSEIT